MKFVHAADLHLDSPLRGLSRYEGAPVDRIRGASRRALVNLVELCLAESVQLLLLAGDLFDGDWRDYSTGLFFAAQMSRLREAGVVVVMIRGNHDADSQISRNLTLPANVLELSTAAPETRILEAMGVAVHGQGFASRAVKEDLAASYPEPLVDHFNIGLLHTAVSGRPGHEPYAPCTLQTLKSKGYAYWALGHVHNRELLCEDPPILFPGNLQGRNVREVGEKGATLVEVVDQRVVRMEARSLDVVRFAVCELEVASLGDHDEILEQARNELSQAMLQAEGRLLCARVKLVGQSELHAALHRDRESLEAELRAIGNDFAGGLWIEKVQLATAPPPSLRELRTRQDALGQVLTAIEEISLDPAQLEALAATLSDLKQRLPTELRRGDEALELEDLDYLRGVLKEVEALLTIHLQGEGEA